MFENKKEIACPKVSACDDAPPYLHGVKAYGDICCQSAGSPRPTWIVRSLRLVASVHGTLSCGRRRGDTAGEVARAQSHPHSPGARGFAHAIMLAH